MTLRESIYDYGGGTASGRPVRAVQVGGPLGAYFPESMLDVRDGLRSDWRRKGGMLGHGGIVVFDDTVDLAQHGALCDGVLRDRIVRQMHAVPNRLDPRRRGDRSDRRRLATERE